MKIRTGQIEYVQESIDRYVELHKKAKADGNHPEMRDAFIHELRVLQILIDDIRIKE